MTQKSVVSAKEEFLVFLRNSNILSTAVRGVTTVASETFSGTGSSQTLTLANNVVRNIRSVTVTSVAKKAYLDYTPTYGSTTTIAGTFTSGTNNIVVSYDYSLATTEKVWGDYPEIKFVVDDAPRVGFDWMIMNNEPMGLGGSGYLNDAIISVKLYAKSLKAIDQYVDLLRTAIFTNQKLLYHFPFINVRSVSPIIITRVNEGENVLAKKVFVKNVDIQLRFQYES